MESKVSKEQMELIGTGGGMNTAEGTYRYLPSCFKETEEEGIYELFMFEKLSNNIKRFFGKKQESKQCDMHNVVEQSEQFSFTDMRDAFNAGDKFRLYLDKNAVGLGHTHDKDIPTSDKIMKTMCFNKWIESKR